MLVAVLLLALAAPPADHKRAPEPLSPAEQLAAKGVAAYRAKAFESAGRYFFRAYELSGEPTQLRNAAKAYDAAGEVELAREYWQRLFDTPGLSETDRAEAQAHLASSTPATDPERTTDDERASIAPARPQPAPLHEDPASVIVERPPSETPSRAPWIIGSAGIAAVVVGAVLYAESSSQRADLVRRLDEKENGLTAGISYQDSLSARSRIVNLRVASGLAITAGIAAITAGTLWLATADDDTDSVAVTPIQGGALATYGATW